MNEDLRPEELNELLGAYALDAVTDAEREQIDQHLLTSPDARAELHRLEHATAWLAHASPRPRQDSWAAVERAMQTDLASEDSRPPPVALDAIRADRERRRSPVARRVFAIAASVAVLAGAGIAVNTLADGGSSTDKIASRQIVLRAPNATIAARLSVNANGAARVRATTLPELDAEHEYQLWARPDPEAPMRSAGLLGRRGDGSDVRIPVASTQVAISIEPVGGSTAPTTDPVALGELPLN